MRRRTAAERSADDGPGIRPPASTITALAIGTALPPWLVGVVVTDLILRIGMTTPGIGWISVSFMLPLVLAPIIAAILDAVTVAVLVARGRFRSDHWWLAGGLFVLNALLGMIATEAYTFRDLIFLHIMAAAVTGYWVLTFAAGALLWRRFAPTYVPLEWSRPDDPDEE